MSAASLKASSLRTSGLPLPSVPEVDVEAIAGKPFEGIDSRERFGHWPCIWRPQQAADKEIYLPYATLEVEVTRAFGLIAADVSTSDPYCVMQLNGVDTGKKTNVVHKSLAPTWDQSFEIDIYHPLDIFTITVHDKDFGTNLGELDVLGFDDDFIGYVDFRVAKLPENKIVHGWFDLSPEHHFEESIEGRFRKKSHHESHKGAGQIHLSMKLKVNGPRDELFALMLPDPTFGEDLPSLDMVTIFDTHMELKDELRIWRLALTRLYLAFPKDPWVDTAVAVFLVWWPRFIPCFLCAGSACLTWKAWMDAVRERCNESSSLSTSSLFSQAMLSFSKLFSKVEAAGRRASIGLAAPLLNSRQSRKAEKAAEMLDGLSHSSSVDKMLKRMQTTASLSSQQKKAEEQGKLRDFYREQHSHARVEKTAKQEKEEQATRELAKLLSNMSPVMSGEDKTAMRRMQKALGQVTEHVETLNDIIDEEQNLLIAALVFTCIAPVLIAMHAWIAFVLQVGLSLAICFYLLKDTIIGRSIKAVSGYSYLVKRRKNLHFHLALQEDHEGKHVVDKEISRHLSSLHMIEHNPSELYLKAKGHAHEMVRKTYVEPTWCYGCGGFLWGVTHQGLQCRWCYRNFCKACAAHACDTVAGPRSCDVERPPGWEETASVSDWATSTVGTQNSRPGYAQTV